MALCCYPHVKVEISDFSQTYTTATIFQQSNHFRQKYLEIASWAVSLLNFIWVQVEHCLLQTPNLRTNQLQSKESAGKMPIKLWWRVEQHPNSIPNIWVNEKKQNFHILNFILTMILAQVKKIFWDVFLGMR